MRLAFFGLPLAACLLLADGHEIVLAALSRPGAPGRRRLVQRLGAERVLSRPGASDPRLAARVRALSPDLVVSWFWTTRLPLSVVDAARWGGIGAHPSLLPRHRGPDPTYHAILAGDEVSGVTVHRLAADYDTGAVLAQARLPIDPSWNAFDLARALDRPSLRLLRETVRRFAEGAPPAEVPQDERLATLAPFPEEDDLWIRWGAPTAEVLRQIRALAPAPGAVTEIAGRIVTVLRASAAPAPAVLEVPGEAAFLGGRAVVRTGDGAVILLSFDVEGAPARDEDLGALLGSSC